MTEQIITPFEVTSENEINYEKLIDKFGCTSIDSKMIDRWEKVTGVKAHLLLRRGIYFSHQDLDRILDSRVRGEPVYLYTGRGPSSDALHIGHIIPFMFTKYLQDALDAIVVIQMSDDEKFLFKGGDLDDYYRLARENAKDIIACGFRLDKTYIFSNFKEFGGALYRTELLISNSVTGNHLRGLYGSSLDDTIGKIAWPTKQCAPTFSQSFPFIFGDKVVRCLVPMGVDQAPYFRMARRLKIKGFLRPSTIHSKFLPALEGNNGKMSSSTQGATIYLNYTEKKVRKTINKYAYSGGRATIDEHKLLGGCLDVDIAYQYLIFFEEDDGEIKRITEEYSSGRMSSGEIKRIVGDVIWKIIDNHQKERVKITENIIDNFFEKNRSFVI